MEGLAAWGLVLAHVLAVADDHLVVVVHVLCIAVSHESLQGAPAAWHQALKVRAAAAALTAEALAAVS